MDSVIVAGLGESGISAAELLLFYGKRVLLYDDNSAAFEGEAAAGLVSRGCVRLKRAEDVYASGASLAVLSPGVSRKLALVSACERAGIPAVSEPEFAARYTGGAAVAAVTGTDGKSTVCALLGHILNQSGITACVCGNFGNSLSREVLKVQIGQAALPRVYVIEMSSYQLEGCVDFKPDIAVLTNLAPDHLERHGTFENYAEAKLRLFKNMGAGGLAVIGIDALKPLGAYSSANETDALAVGESSAKSRSAIKSRLPRCKKVCFSAADRRCYARISGGNLMLGKRILCGADELKIPGVHNLSNALAAACAAEALGAGVQQTAHALKSFAGLAHRLQYAGQSGGVKIYNDSKSTNAHACLAAVRAIAGGTVLILGGSDGKNEDFYSLFKALPDSVRMCVLTGAASKRLAGAAADARFKECILEPDFKRAVVVALLNCKSGENLLFSPACASFDRFKNFEHRGESFLEIISAFSDKGN